MKSAHFNDNRRFIRWLERNQSRIRAMMDVAMVVWIVIGVWILLTR